jgi:hypothetical protein
MSGKTHDPTVGTPRHDASPSGPLKPADPERDEGGKDPAVPPAPGLSSSSSGDELSAILTEAIVQPHHDPFLGEFKAGDPTVEPTPKSNSEDDGPGSTEASGATSASGVADPKNAEFPSDLVVPSEPVAPDESATAGSFDALSALASLTGLDPTPKRGTTSRAPLVTRPAKPSPPNGDAIEDDEDEDAEDEDERPSRRGSWLTLLLVSYASAVTLGLLWVLASGRKLREGDEIDLFPATADRLDPGRRANQSRTLVPPPPLAADHLAGLGQTVRLGSLEATPLEVRSGQVDLAGAFDESEQRDGGTDALRLKLRLKNVSSDTIFVPLDEAFIRERVVGKPDSFIETAKGASIAMYPLAVASEWSIKGQAFNEIQPGEAFDAELVSAPDVAARLTPEMTWRIRLRTGMDQTDTLGVRFRKDEIQPGS